MKSFPYFGSVSSGTTKPGDLIPRFLRILEDLDPVHGADVENLFLSDLVETLNELAPAYCYFGARTGDKSDFGFWLSQDSIDATFDGLKVNDLSEVPPAYVGEVLHTNDHGNLTLYDVDTGSFREVWSLV